MEKVDSGSQIAVDEREDVASPQPAGQPPAPSRFRRYWEIGLILYAVITIGLLAWTASKQDRVDFGHDHPVITGLLGAAVLLFIVGTVIWVLRAAQGKTAEYLPTVIQFRTMAVAFFVLAVPVFSYEYGRDRALTLSPPLKLSSVVDIASGVASGPGELATLSAEVDTLAQAVDAGKGVPADQAADAAALSGKLSALGGSLASTAGSADSLNMHYESAALYGLGRASNLLAEAMSSYASGLQDGGRADLRRGRRQLDQALVLLDGNAAQAGVADATSKFGVGFVDGKPGQIRKGERAAAQAGAQIESMVDEARAAAVSNTK